MESEGRYQFGPFLIDVRERRLHRDGQVVALTPKSFDVLVALVEQPGRLLSKDELLHKVWPDAFVEESNLAYNVFALRKALGDAADGGLYIETVPKRGYRFAAPVTPVGSEPGTRTQPVAPADPLREGFGAERHATASTKADDRVPFAAAPRRARGFKRIWALGGAVALMVPLTLYFAAWSRRAPRHAELRAVPLTSISGWVSTPSLSPDGRYVAFTWTGPKQDNRDLYVQQVGAGAPLRLTTDLGEDRSASWSPDGRTIAFLRRAADQARAEVRLIAPLGGLERKIGDIRARPRYTAHDSVGWCPDATCVIVTDSQGPRKSDALFAIAIDSGEKRQLTFPPDMVSDLGPLVSPDGRTLIFRRNTTPSTGAFYRVALTGQAVPQGEPVRLTEPLNVETATWTRDGREIVFSSLRALWRFDAQKGGTPTRLASIGQDGQAPVIAGTADGRQRLVYLRSVADVNVWKVTIPAPSAPALDPPVPAIASTRIDFIPDLSPDGRRLTFVSDRSGEPQVWVADVDGSHAFPLTGIRNAGYPGWPRWSPDGTMISYHGDPQGRSDVIVAPAGAGNPRILTAKLSNGAFPSFSRDGRWVYFSRVEGVESRIWKLPVHGGDPVRVTNNPAMLAIESSDGRDLYYVEVSDGPSALWRLPLPAGEPVKVLDGVFRGSFAVVDRGIYYLELGPLTSATKSAVLPANPGGVMRLRYFDFETRQSTIVADLASMVGWGLTASRDGRQVFFSRVDSVVDELMVVDDFR